MQSEVSVQHVRTLDWENSCDCVPLCCAVIGLWKATVSYDTVCGASSKHWKGKQLNASH